MFGELSNSLILAAHLKAIIDATLLAIQVCYPISKVPLKI